MSKRDFTDRPNYDEGHQAEGLSEVEAQEESLSDSEEESFPDSEFEEEKTSLFTRETKIGLAVVLVLVIVLGVVLVKRLVGTGAPEEAKQATAKAASPTPGSSSPASQADSPVPKPTVVQGTPSSARPSPSSEPTPWIPSSWTGGGKQPPSGTTGTAAAREKNGPAFPSPSPALAAGKATQGEGKASGQASAGGPSGSSALGGNNLAASSAPTNFFPSGESLGASNNPLRADSRTASSPSSLSPKEPVGAPSGSATGPILLHSPNMGNNTSLQEGQAQENRSSSPSGPPPSVDAFSPYSPPSLSAGVSPGGTLEAGRTSSQGASVPAKSPVLSAAPSTDSARAPTALPSQPAGPPVSPTPLQPSAALPTPRLYVVQSGDSYWTISERFYGTGTYYQALAEYNRSRIARPEQLRLGDQLIIPEREELQRLYPHLCPASGTKEALSAPAGGAAGMAAGAGPGVGPSATSPGGLPVQPGASPPVVPSGRTYRVYIVQEGDTIYEIARYLLGKPSRWVEIYELNKEVLGNDIEHLRPGIQLAIPPAEPAGSTPSPMSALPPGPLPR